MPPVPALISNLPATASFGNNDPTGQNDKALKILRDFHRLAKFEHETLKEQEKPQSRAVMVRESTDLAIFRRQESNRQSDLESRERQNERELRERWENYLKFLDCHFDELNASLKKLIETTEEKRGGGLFGFLRRGGKFGRFGKAAGLAAGAAGVGGAAATGVFGKTGQALTKFGKGAGKFLGPLAILSALDSATGFLGPSIGERKKSGESFFNRENNETFLGSLVNSRFGDYASFTGGGAALGALVGGPVGAVVGGGLGLGLAAVLENYEKVRDYLFKSSETLGDEVEGFLPRARRFFESVQNWSISGTTDEIVAAIDAFSIRDHVIEPTRDFLRQVNQGVIQPVTTFFGRLSFEDHIKTPIQKIWQGWEEANDFQRRALEYGLNIGKELSVAVGRIMAASARALGRSIDEVFDYFPETKAGIIGIYEDVVAFSDRAQQRVREISTQVKDNALGLWNAAVSVVSYPVGKEATEVFNYIQNKAHQIVVSVKEGAIGLWDLVFVKPVERTGEAAAAVYESITRKASSLLASVKDSALSVWDWVIPDIKVDPGFAPQEIYGRIKQQALNLLASVKEGALRVWDWVIPDFSKEPGSDPKGIYARLQEKASSLLASVKDSALSVWDWVIPDAKVDPGSDPKGIYARLQDKAASLLASVKDSVLSFWDWTIPSEKDSGTDSQGVYAQIKEKAQTILATVKQESLGAWEWTATFVDNRGKDAQNLYESVTQKAETILAGISSYSRKLWDWVPESPKLTTAGAAAQNLYLYVSNKSQEILQSLQDFSTKKWDWVLPQLPTPISAAKSVYDYAKRQAESLSRSVQMQASAAWDILTGNLKKLTPEELGVITLFEDTEEKLKTFYREISDSVDDFLSRNLGFRIFSSKKTAPVLPPGKELPPTTLHPELQRLAKQPPTSRGINFYDHRGNQPLVENSRKIPPPAAAPPERKDKGGQISSAKSPVRNPVVPNLSNIPVLPDDRGLSLISIYDF